MPGTKSRWRRILVLIGICTILLGLVLVALPVWFPWLARPVARSIGFEFENYRRVGLTRFELTGVRGRLDDVEITVDRFEAFLPHRWLWERWVHGARTADYALANDWAVRVHRRSEPPPPESREQSTFAVLEDIDEIAQLLRTWVPAARLLNGTVGVEGLSAGIPEADWSGGRFEVQARTPELPSAVSARLDVTRSGRWHIEMEGGLPDVAVNGELVRHASSWEFEGTLGWRSNQVGMAARFDESGWLPAEANISGADLGIPGGAVGAIHYGELRGEFSLRWLAGKYTLMINGAAEPGAAASNEIWPRLEFNLNGHGDMESATLEVLQARAPWFTFILRNPIPVNLTDLRLAEPALVDIRAELASLNPGWSGVANVELEVTSGTNVYPAVAFRVRGTELSANDITLSDLEGIGSFDWPLVELERGTARLGTNSVAHVWGELDLRRNELASAGLEWEGDYLSRFLPEWVAVSGLRARVLVEGPLAQLRHEGEVQVAELVTPQINPTTVALRWNGEALALESFEASAMAGDSRLVIGGEAQGELLPRVAVQARLDILNLERDGAAVYLLEEPVQIRWQDGDQSDWQAAIDGWAWKGEEGRSLSLTGEVHWPTAGRAQLKTSQTLLSDVRDFWPGPNLELNVSTLGVLAGWTNGPIVWQMEVEARAGRSKDVPLIIGARVRGDEAGIVVETLALGGADAPTVAIQGSLPLVLHMTGSPFIRILPEGAFELAASSPVADVVRFELDDGNRLELFEPELDLRVNGTVNRPEGQIRASLSRASWQSTRLGGASPRVEHLRMEVELRPDRIELNRLEFELEGQPVMVQGSWPLGTYAWERLFAEGSVPDWQEASGRVLIEGAELAPLARHLPTLLTTQGKMDLDLSIQPGLRLDGFLALTNAMTRPLGPLSPVRDIEAMIAFSGRTARVDRFAARLGGRPIHLGGHATLSDSRELLYSLRLQGTNAPLVREPGLLMRANLDLNVANRSGQNPTITGSVQLRDGLLLQDVGSLLVDRIERPSMVPPYFSITNLPFARWQLDVKVTGDQFLRVRSPAFIGTVSTDGVVQGSLARPVIQADVRLPRGRILFPFGKLEVEGAYATLSGTEPRGPRIDLVAAGQNYGYNVRLEVTGTMDDLHVLFTSTPPLSSEDILLMLTAGELPSNEISYSAEARAGRLITYLGREVVTRFFGDEMGEERLIINSGENIARSGRTTYSVEYRLTPRWSLVGEYDQFNALNAGLKWRIYSR